MSTFQARSGASGTVNMDLADLPDGSKGIEHVVLDGGGNPMVPVQDASIQALASAVTTALAAMQARSVLRPVVTAGVALSGQIALMYRADGTVIPADPTSAGYVYAGISMSAAQSGATLISAFAGPMTDPSWSWTIGPVWVAPGGVLTQTPPTAGFSHQIGVAIAATTIQLAPGLPILLA